MNFKVDKQKALELAKELGLDVSFGSKNPGVIMGSGEHKDFNDFFPEINYEFNQAKFITKDSGELSNLSKNITIKSSDKKTQMISVISIDKDFVTDSHGKWSWAS
ncbi:hypothetical protein [Schinkia azotoformans]|uniref:hypothetical protein n=1 Tax=Schinkia azotoformans TaxID=1454 RepID=UPI002DB7D570|nr:hypothetical protein [Schinkia azotoformans]MEC1718770.1 hypothetical protein [Schinkia azotoformans]MED4413018.1 hypothetical protein [Schinkia azotoformans]